MRFIKKIALVGILLLASLSLTACGIGQNSTKPSTSVIVIPSSQAPSIASQIQPSKDLGTYPVVARINGDLLPITSNNALYTYDKSLAVDKGGNCSALAWQYIFDTYQVNVPMDFIGLLGYAPSTLQKDYPDSYNALKPYMRATPAVGELVVMGSGTKFTTDQMGTISADAPAHVGVITGINPDGSLSVINGGVGTSTSTWGLTFTHFTVVPNTGWYQYYDVLSGVV